MASGLLLTPFAAWLPLLDYCGFHSRARFSASAI